MFKKKKNMSGKLVLRRSNVYFALRSDIQHCIQLIKTRRLEIERYTETHFIIQDPTRRQAIGVQIPVPQTRQRRGFHAAISIIGFLNTILENVRYVDRFLQRSSNKDYYSSLGAIAEYIDTVLKELSDEALSHFKYKDVPTQKLRKPILLQKSFYEKMKQLSTDVYRSFLTTRDALMNAVSVLPTQEQTQELQQRPSKKRPRI